MGIRMVDRIADRASQTLDTNEKSALEQLCAELEFTCTDMLLPPAELRFLVAGTDDILQFLKLGHLGADCIVSLLRANGVDLNSLRRILDFGCGCGRVSRFLSKMLDSEVDGTDLNPRLIAWLSQNSRKGRFFLNQLMPPTRHDDNSYDLLYALSVYTHLPEKEQSAWIKEFSRIVKRGGYVIVTTHGKHEQYMSLLTDDERQRFFEGKLVVHSSESAGGNDCFTLQSRDQVEGIVRPFFEIIEFREHGSTGTPVQDIYLMKNLKSE